MIWRHSYTICVSASNCEGDVTKRVTAVLLREIAIELNFTSQKNVQIWGRSTYRVKINCSHYRPGVAQRVGRGIALLFHDRGTRSGWVVSSTPRPHFTAGKDLVPIVQEAGLAPGPVWTGGKSRPHRDSIPDRPARSQSLYRLRYRAHTYRVVVRKPGRNGPLGRHRRRCEGRIIMYCK